MKGQALLLAIVTAVVVAAVVMGFLALGTPGEARKDELDRKRIQDLRNLSNGIHFLWNDHRELPPKSLEAWMNGRPLKGDMLDPVTHRPYGYTNLGDGKFELCATFDTEVKEADLDYDREWAHPAGPHCFQLDVKHPRGPERGP